MMGYKTKTCYHWTGEHRPPKRWEWYLDMVKGLDGDIESEEEDLYLSRPIQAQRNLFDSRWILRREEKHYAVKEV